MFSKLGQHGETNQSLGLSQRTPVRPARLPPGACEVAAAIRTPKINKNVDNPPHKQNLAQDNPMQTQFWWTEDC